MRNIALSKIEGIYTLARQVPFFGLDDLASVEKNKNYLKILLSRYEKSGRVVRLKKGLYVADDYLRGLKETGRFSAYLELAANILHSPSYLSLEYVLYGHNLLTEIPVNLTSVTIKKTAVFSNKLGNFYYRSVKEKLFCGFETINDGGFSVLRATKAKALFDYLYLRQHDIGDRESFDELRLNVKGLTSEDKKELAKYAAIDGSSKMRKILTYFIKI